MGWGWVVLFLIKCYLNFKETKNTLEMAFGAGVLAYSILMFRPNVKGKNTLFDDWLSKK